MVGVEILQKNEPYYLPGYTGYVPRNRYVYGKTYGDLTHETLLDPAVDHADELILVDRETTHETVKPTKADLQIVRSRSERTDPIYAHPMLSGYTGFVPQMGDERDKPFEIQAIQGIADFERQQLKKKASRELLRKTIELQSGVRHPNNVEERLLLRSKFKLPLIMVRPERVGFLKSQPVNERYEKPKDYNASPYFMDNLNPEKYFINGYTGYIPYRRVHFGKTRKAMANDGLRDFTSNYLYKKRTEWAPVAIFSDEKVETSHQVSPKGYEVYRKDTALMPSYTGHVPGAKEKIGATYGVSSKDAHRLIQDHLFHLELRKCKMS
ncbi:UPF0605 protein CG18335-like [Copidosoma floridanum]|uniref:UPF0605 protein CG18335-like n=1 Tax=Copidosoma floridanum TaxID=29053 RepID=UPI0006C952B6|nr:UPF0605 protein CG18335-like [Copidosoma floridanum]